MHLDIVYHLREKLKKKNYSNHFLWGFSGGSLVEVVRSPDVVMDTV